MTKEMTLEQMKLEMAADKDVRRFIELLQSHFDRLNSSGETTNKCLSEKLGMDPSYLSRTVNGRNVNPNIKTIAKIFRALDLRIEPNVQALADVTACRSNMTASQAYDEACWHVELKTSAIKPVLHHKIKEIRPDISYEGAEKKRWKRSIGCKEVMTKFAPDFLTLHANDTTDESDYAQ